MAAGKRHRTDDGLSEDVSGHGSGSEGPYSMSYSDSESYSASDPESPPNKRLRSSADAAQTRSDDDDEEDEEVEEDEEDEEDDEEEDEEEEEDDGGHGRVSRGGLSIAPSRIRLRVPTASVSGKRAPVRAPIPPEDDDSEDDDGALGGDAGGSDRWDFDVV